MAFLCPRQEVYELKVECHSSQLAIVFCALVDVVRNQSQLNCSIGLSLSASVITSKVEFWLMHEQWQLLAGNSCPGARPTPTLSCVVHILVGTTRWVQPPVVLDSHILSCTHSQATGHPQILSFSLCLSPYLPLTLFPLPLSPSPHILSLSPLPLSPSLSQGDIGPPGPRGFPGDEGDAGGQGRPGVPVRTCLYLN